MGETPVERRTSERLLRLYLECQEQNEFDTKELLGLLNVGERQLSRYVRAFNQCLADYFVFFELKYSHEICKFTFSHI